VKTDLCNFCLKSGILCSKCQAKVRSGKVTQTDLTIAKLLLELENKYPPLQDVYFHKAVEANGVLAVIVGKGDVAKMLSYGGKIMKAISEKTGRAVRLLEHGGDYRKFLEDLFMPLSILTINTIWLPDGTTETRVILKRRSRSRFPFNIEALKEIARKVRGIALRVEFAD
jgi:transcription antitermination factor NusA-like protein